MLIFVWSTLCVVFVLVHTLLGDSGHVLELFALLGATVFFLINRFKDKV